MSETSTTSPPSPIFTDVPSSPSTKNNNEMTYIIIGIVILIVLIAIGVWCWYKYKRVQTPLSPSLIGQRLPPNEPTSGTINT